MEDTKTVTLKLLIDTKANKVLFAEAPKEFADFLFFLLSLPIGTVINLLAGKSMAGSVGNLYNSFSNLKETYLQPNLQKDILLKPNPSISCANFPLLTASSPAGDVAGVNKAPAGFVQRVVTYMISDDLTVTPMSMISSISMMNKFNVSNLSVLEEREIQVGNEEGLKLLKASFESTTVLTDAFLGKAKDSKVIDGDLK